MRKTAPIKQRFARVGVRRELGGVGVKLARAGSIDEVRSHIGHLSPACRAALARLYLRFLARVAAANTESN